VPATLGYGMNKLQTNRDLYLAIAALIDRYRDDSRTLEEYLRALWAITQPLQQRSVFTLNELMQVLTEAFTYAVPPFEESWRDRYLTDLDNREGFEGFEARILRQIVDLREMAEQGTLNDEQRYFGITSPRQSFWYNFVPCAFLECAVTGSYGGWLSDDNTGRVLVNGPMVVVGDDGELHTVNPEDVKHPILNINEVSWDDFRDFLGNGQWYE
jgi:hypothetical protein